MKMYCMKTKFLKKIKFDIIEVSSTLLCINCPWFYSTELSVCCIYRSKTVFKFLGTECLNFLLGLSRLVNQTQSTVTQKNLHVIDRNTLSISSWYEERVLVGIRSRSGFWHSLNASL